MDMDQMGPAAQSIHEAVTRLRGTEPTMKIELASALVAEGILLSRTAKASEAEKQIREAISLLEQALPPGHPSLLASHGALGESLLAQGRVVDAEKLLLQSATLPAGRAHVARRHALQRLIKLYEHKQDRQAAERTRHELAAFERQVQSQ